jgi:hypothetical protein
MNNQNDTIRALWAQSYRLARSLDQSSHGAHRHVLSILSGKHGNMYLRAVESIASRESYTVRLMNRALPISDSVTCHWIVNRRCNAMASWGRS